MLHRITVCPPCPVTDPAALREFEVTLFVNVAKYSLEKCYGELTWDSLAVR